jgi:hypothetical protein
MSSGETIIKIPEDLAHELDRLAGHKRWTAYAVDVLWRDVRRNRQREALKLTRGAWSPEAHPELTQGGAAYVEQVRSEPDERFEKAIDRWRQEPMATILLDPAVILDHLNDRLTAGDAGLRAGEEAKTKSLPLSSLLDLPDRT